MKGVLNERVVNKDHWRWVYRECVVASPNWMARLNETKELFFTLQYPEDYDLVLKWYSGGFSIVPISKRTLNWREHADRISKNSSHYSQASFFNLKINHFVKNELDENSSLYVWGTNKKGKLISSILRELKINFQWMSNRPESYPKGTSIDSYIGLS